MLAHPPARQKQAGQSRAARRAPASGQQRSAAPGSAEQGRAPPFSASHGLVPAACRKKRIMGSITHWGSGRGGLSLGGTGCFPSAAPRHQAAAISPGPPGRGRGLASARTAKLHPKSWLSWAPLQRDDHGRLFAPGRRPA
eukprot:gene9796-biopygen12257